MNFTDNLHCRIQRLRVHIQGWIGITHCTCSCRGSIGSHEQKNRRFPHGTWHWAWHLSAERGVWELLQTDLCLLECIPPGTLWLSQRWQQPPESEGFFFGLQYWQTSRCPTDLQCLRAQPKAWDPRLAMCGTRHVAPDPLQVWDASGIGPPLESFSPKLMLDRHATRIW